ncbi:MAG: sulfatase-like hydrolase/transferase, partial [Anaerolineae bacterium]|nr:sulfatase-like hydrolase/transferase [Anaerolineae bacterium]
ASRAAMFTSMYGHNTGVYSFNRWAHHRSWVQDLNEAGYHCVNIGKMHIAPRDDPMGFHERVIVENPTNWALRGSGVDDDWGRWLYMHGHARPNDRQITDPDWRFKFQAVPWHLDEELHSDVFIGNSALAWIERYPLENRNKPVFLQIGFTGPHEPYDPLPRILEFYDGRILPPAIQRTGELDEKPPQHRAHQRYFDNHMHEAQINMPEATPADIDNMRRHYYAKISTLDEKLGEILEALEMRGLLDNALVIFTSDHGDLIGDHQMAYKWLMYDPITNVPLILWDTRQEQQGVTDNLVSLIDIGPTILEAAGVMPPRYLEGTSLMGYLTGSPPEPHTAVFCEDNYEIMVRTEKYKMVHYIYQEEIGELYDLERDPHELYNLFGDPAYSDVRTEMKDILTNWLARSLYQTAGYKNAQVNMSGSTPLKGPYLIGNFINNPKLWDPEKGQLL